MDESPATTEQPRILVSDDDPDILNLVCFRLEQAGYRTLRATNGEEALALAKEQPPALMVLDVRMPGLTGLEVARRAREDAALGSVPIVMLTATVGDSDVEAGFEAGADDYIRKPFNPQELESRINVLLRRR